MEQYKQEFIEFMVDSERKKIPVFYECRRICDRFSVKETG